VVLPKGKAAGLKTLRETRAGIEAKLPASMVQLIEQQLSGLREIECRVKWFELQIAALLRDQAQARKLNQIPGVGVLGATALAAVLADASAWRNGREFAATLGLVPRHSGTGGKVRIGPVSKRGDPYLRTLLVNGARSVISHPQPPRWAVQLLARRPFNVAVVALANKMARTAWALVAHGRSYDKNWQSQPPDRLQRLPGAASEPAN
jgi:transposase